MGLLTPAERKSVEPLAAVTAPSRVSAQHQSLLHFVAQSPWSDARILAKVLELTLPAITAREPIEAWIIDDTSFPKKGKHSVGVTRQSLILGAAAHILKRQHGYRGPVGKRQPLRILLGRAGFASDQPD
jgi:SRSO17 transposase